MLCLVDVALDRVCVGLAAPILPGALIRHELGNPGVRINGLIRRQILRR